MQFRSIILLVVALSAGFSLRGAKAAVHFSERSVTLPYDSFFGPAVPETDWRGETVTAIPRDPTGGGTGVVLTGGGFSWPHYLPRDSYIALLDAEAKLSGQTEARLNDSGYFPANADRDSASELRLELERDFSFRDDERKLPYFAEVVSPGGDILARGRAVADLGARASHRFFNAWGRVSTEAVLQAGLDGGDHTKGSALSSIQTEAEFRVYHEVPFRLTGDFARHGDANVSFAIVDQLGRTAYEVSPNDARFESFELEGTLDPGFYTLRTRLDSYSLRNASGFDHQGGMAEFWYAFRALVPEDIFTPIGALSPSDPLSDPSTAFGRARFWADGSIGPGNSVPEPTALILLVILLPMLRPLIDNGVI